MSVSPPNQRSCQPPTYAAFGLPFQAISKLFHSCKTHNSINRRRWSLEYIGMILQSSFQTLLFISPTQKKQEQQLPFLIGAVGAPAYSCVAGPTGPCEDPCCQENNMSLISSGQRPRVPLGLTGHGGLFETGWILHHTITVSPHGKNDQGLTCCSACSVARALPGSDGQHVS